MKISLPSITQILESIYRITLRFPFVLTTAILAAVGAVLFIEISFDSSYEPNNPLKLWLVGGLGISFLYGLTVFTEQKNWSYWAKTGTQAGGFLLLVVYYFVLGDDVEHHPHQVWYQFVLFGLAAHLFVAFSPFINSGKTDQFWEYNKALFLRFLLSALYSGVLFVGLSVAVLSFSELLEFDVDGARYGQLFVILGGVFNTGFFLAGISKKETIASDSIEFPKGLRLFSQYVLIPLVTVYIVILYLYLGKIILQWELPNGWVSNLVLTFSIAGILSLLLLYPIRDSEENTWVKVYSRYYYLALIPLIGLLIFSIWVRISEYGVTINRYFVSTLGVWLTGIVGYYILSKAKNIKVIPISLCVIALGVSFGPLGASAVSERSQLGRFEEILNGYGYLNEDGKAQKSETEIPFEERKELSSITFYLIETHGIEVFENVLSTPVKNNSVLYAARKILEELNIEYLNQWSVEDTKKADYFNYSVANNYELDISEYDIMLPQVNNFRKEYSRDVIGNFEVVFQKDSMKYDIRNISSGYLFSIDIQPKIEHLIKSTGSSPDLSVDIMSEIVEDDKWRLKLILNSVSGTTGDSTEVNSINSTIFIKLKK